MSYWKIALKSSAAATALLVSTSAFAQTKAIDLPAEDAGRSIPELARQAGVQIIAPGQALHGVVTPALRGEYEIRAALSTMLRGTELRVAADDGHTIVLARDDSGTAAGTVSTQAPPAELGSTTIETVAVTGSRVISDAANSPTPLTVVSTTQLQATTPSNIPDALNKLPVFQGSSQPRSSGNGGSSAGINVLALRNFGAQRTLVLSDGHRVAPANANGTVDVDTLPQMLMSRVDVVTGGASAVYGSDAITGVVNFVLDKHYSGFKFNINSGVSNFGDGASYKAEAAAGTDLFGGRGHFEGSVEYFHQDGVPETARPYGPQYWLSTGSGTVANPRVFTINGRNATASDGGIIHCTGCSLNNMQFIGNGVVGPFLHGKATGTGSIESGGDGAYAPFGSAITEFRTATAFGRFSYKLNDTTEFYVQGSGSEGFATGTWYPTNMIAGVTASTMFTDNPFLSPQLQQQLNPAGTPGKTFQLTKFINQFGREGSPGTWNVNRYLTGAAGLDGVLFDNFTWDLYYSHSESRQDVTNYRNPNNQRWYAAIDAVTDPKTGNIVCYVSTTAYASLYPGCMPMNPFGTSSISQQSYDYISSNTRFIMTNIMDDVSGSISGEVFDLPAGPIKAALSAEMRWNSYDVNSNASPTDFVNCTGLRLCSSTTPLWQQNTVASATASNNVWEFSGEVDVPVLKDVPMVQSLDVNLAGRYTDYSTSGSVQTWKVGLDYHVNDDIRFRATTSVDIRAPTLNDLFSPVQSSVTSFTDIHTGGYGILFISSQGNPNLLPEVARTYTAGIVLTPSWLPGVTLSYDYYHIDIKNGIGALSASNNQIQNLCEDSGGTSQYCTLYQRPLPFSDRTPANYPTAIFSKNLNTAYQGIEGSDIEANYHLNLADVSENLPGAMDFRVLVNIQPVNESQQFTGAAFTFASYPKGHVSAFINYDIGNWLIGLQDRWISGYPLANQPTIIYNPSRIRSQNYIDLNLQRRFSMDGGNYTGYFTVQNLFNAAPPLVPGGSGSPGLTYPVGPGGDVMGRYFTIGLRGSL